MASKTTTLPDHPVHLTRKESELLTLLRQHAGNCLSRDYLLQTIWGYTNGVRTRTLDVPVQRLRRNVKLFHHGRARHTVLCHPHFSVPQSA